MWGVPSLQGCLCRIGDRVFGQAAGCLGTAVVADALTVVPQPPRLAAIEAATVPTVFMTADACLTHAARIQPGSRVLVHAATGRPPSSPAELAAGRILGTLCSLVLGWTLVCTPFPLPLIRVALPMVETAYPWLFYVQNACSEMLAERIQLRLGAPCLKCECCS